MNKFNPNDCKLVIDGQEVDCFSDSVDIDIEYNVALECKVYGLKDQIINNRLNATGNISCEYSLLPFGIYDLEFKENSPSFDYIIKYMDLGMSIKINDFEHKVIRIKRGGKLIWQLGWNND